MRPRRPTTRSVFGSTLTLAQCHWSAGEADKAEELFRGAVKEDRMTGRPSVGREFFS